MTTVSVIILSWNRRKDTVETIRSLAKSDTKGFSLEIFAVDNDSKDDSVEYIKKEFAKIKSNSISTKLLVNPRNLGFAEGNNVGMRDCLEREINYVVLLNDDVIMDKNTIKHLLEYAQNHKDVGAVSPKIYFAKGFEFKSKYKNSDLGKVFWYAGGKIDWDNVYGSNFGVDEVDKGQYDKVREIDFATGCCVMYPAETLKEVGVFDKRYFAYLEDSDLSQRIKSVGKKVVYLPKSFMWHKVSQSSGIGSELNDYFITRNRMLFGMKYAKVRTKFALMRESFRLLFGGRKWQKVGIRDYYLRKFGIGSWGK